MTKSIKDKSIMKNHKEISDQAVFTRNMFSFYEDKEDTGWLISMSDLMSLLLVFFLVWTAANIPALEKAKRNYKDAEKIDVVKQAGTEHPTTSGNKITEMVYEFIPTKMRNNFVLVAFKESDKKYQKEDGDKTAKRAVARLQPVDMQVVSIKDPYTF